MIRISLTIAPQLSCLIASAPPPPFHYSCFEFDYENFLSYREFCAYTFPINLSSIFCKNCRSNERIVDDELCELR